MLTRKGGEASTWKGEGCKERRYTILTK